MRCLAQQRGVTLVEILVGFVIFTTSLVAILDFVSEQNYHYHRSSTYLEKLQTVYDYSVLDLDMSQHLSDSALSSDFNLSISALAMDAFGQGDSQRLLVRFEYRIPGPESDLTWAVIKFE